jgi:acyl-CoA oxidase
VIDSCNINFRNVFVPDSNKLPGAKDFKNTNDILRKSRMMISFVAAGAAVGCYDVTIDYLLKRKQFGTPIGSFQIQQERITRVMGTIQSFLMLLW